MDFVRTREKSVLGTPWSWRGLFFQEQACFAGEEEREFAAVRRVVWLARWRTSEDTKYDANAGDEGLIPGSGRSPREGNGSPLQYSCWGNPMDRGA